MSDATAPDNPRAIPEEAGYEELVQMLESSVARLETGELSLEDAVIEYELGMQIVERCNQLLDRAELRVTELSERASAGARDLSEEQGLS